jgi:hypothetical protein
MKDNKPVVKRKPSMSKLEVVLLIAYIGSGLFMEGAAFVHLGCWPSRSRSDVPVCPPTCLLGIDLAQIGQNPARLKHEAVPLMPCLPWE